MNNKLIESIDLAICESQNPIIIEGNYGDGKSTYLRDKYSPFAVYLPEAKTTDLFVNYFGDKKIYPKWYVNLCTAYMQSPDKKNLLVLDALEQAEYEIVTRIFKEIILNENNEYYIPENTQIVFITNGKTPEEQERLFKEYSEYITFVKGKDRDNIQIIFGKNKREKNK